MVAPRLKRREGEGGECLSIQPPLVSIPPPRPLVLRRREDGPTHTTAPLSSSPKKSLQKKQLPGALHNVNFEDFYECEHNFFLGRKATATLEQDGFAEEEEEEDKEGEEGRGVTRTLVSGHTEHHRI